MKKLLQKQNVKMPVYVVLCLLAVPIIFSLLHLSQTGLLLPRAYDRPQHFPQHVLYEELRDFELLENGVIRSTSSDPWITVHTDPEIAGDMLIIGIRDLNVDETSAQVFFALPDEPLSEGNSIKFTLRNGDNILQLPDSGSAHLRLDLAESPDISMVVSAVTLRHANDMISNVSFWLMFAILTLICAAVLYFLVFRTAFVLSLFSSAKKTPFDDPDEKMDISQVHTKKATKGRLVSILYYVAASLIPNIFLLINYNYNRYDTHLIYWHILILAGIFAVIGIILFIIFRLAVKSREGALLLSLLFWILFWFYEAMFSALGNMFTYMSISTTAFMVFLASLLTVILLILRRYAGLILKTHQFIIILAFVITGLFIFNLIPGVGYEIELQRARAAGVVTEPFYIKRDFYIDESLPAPDIYWLHVDGMMSMETVEKYFEVPQDHLREELAKRGFIVYPYAELNASYTYAALAALLSPAFYDSFWGEVLTRYETYLRHSRYVWLRYALRNHNLTYSYLNLNYEMVTALVQRGYEIEGVSSALLDYMRQNLWNQLVIMTGDIPELLNQATPLNITLIEGHNRIEHEFSPLALFQKFMLYDTHMDYVWVHDPHLTGSDRTAIHVYHMAYEQIARDSLQIIDTILEENPHAVIVMQSDHGFHLQQTQDHLLGLDYSLEQVFELTHSIFSAVRIPEQYGGLDAPLAPLNISRELVNRFVGQNYELLP